MDKAGRYALSVILSYLEETEGCSLLLTQSRWTRQMLPIFRIPTEGGGLLRVNGRTSKNRHRFQVVPVHDAATRLDRRNTKILYRRRKRPVPNTILSRLALDEATAELVATQTATPQSIQVPSLLRFLSRPSDPYRKVFAEGTTLLVSYPRSGNTLVRSYLEQITSVVTGSDTRPNRTLSMALANLHGLVGEGVCSRPQVFVCKTHWPERSGCQQYPAQRAIMLVRNPFDAIDSYWNLCVTNTHTEKVTEEVYQQHMQFYLDLVRNEVSLWKRFHEFWIDAVSKNIPMLIVRYEDLIAEPQRELERILQFSVSPTELGTMEMWKRRIELVLKAKASYGYRSAGPNSTTTTTTTNNTTPATTQAKQMPTHSFGKSLRRFDPDFIKELHDIMESDRDGNGESTNFLKRFGYHVYENDFPNNFSDQETSPSKSVPISPTPSAEGNGSITVNGGAIYLRPLNCPYGRRTRDWRRIHTLDDTAPFPTINSASQQCPI